MVFSKAKQFSILDAASILLVDDDPQILSMLGKNLRDWGYYVTSTRDVDEAFELLTHTEFDVLLCDILMPHMVGMEFLDKLQHCREFDKSTIIIMMSAYADLPTARQAVDRGASDFLVKPFSLVTLLIMIERNLRRRQTEQNRLIEQRNKVLLESIKALSAAMDAKEHRTAEHSARISSLAMMIADKMDMSSTERSTLELAAYMHDIGKIGVSEAILLKPDRLSDKEWKEIKEHPHTGYQILSNIEELSDLAQIIRHHHERIDGTGYPDSLSGEDIPILSRILAVADAFDAMISDRPYRARLTEREAIRRLSEGAGKQFDAKIVDILLFCLKEQKRKAA